VRGDTAVRTSTGVPASPPATLLARGRSVQPRAVVGVLVLLACVVGGARVVGAAGRTEPAWVATRTLASGTTLQPDDVEPREVRLGDLSTAYAMVADGDLVGRVLAHDVEAGALLPLSAVAAASAGGDAQREVTLAVDPMHLPPSLDRGTRVDVYVTPADPSGAVPADSGARQPPTRVLGAVLVVDVERDPARLGSAGDAVGVVVSVPEEDVATLVEALHRGSIDLVGRTA
jgi:hypothetical protein